MRPIHIHLEVSDPRAHRLTSTLHLTDHEGGPIEFFLPTWIPGSYLIREFARFVEEVRAWNEDQTFPVHKVAKNRWRIEGIPEGEIRFSMTVLAADWDLRGTWAGERDLFVNGTHIFPFPVDQLARKGTLTIDLPEEWEVFCALDAGHAPRSWRFYNYDDLVDNPILAGPNLDTIEFTIDGIPHTIVVDGKGAPSAEDLLEGVSQIVRNHAQRFDGLPYPRYYFLLLVGDRRGGGLEHNNCCALQVSRDTFVDDTGWDAFWSLVAHEHIHAWLVKRLRPAGLTPYDYENEQYTPALWVSEGWTDYLCELTVRQTGLMSRQRWLKSWSERLWKLEQVFGRHVDSLADASRNTWIKLYRRHAHLHRLSVSYYLKGSVAAWILDIHLRQLTNGQASLDGLVCRMMREFPLEKGGFPVGAELEAVGQWLAELSVESDLGERVRTWVRQTGDLPIDETLSLLGLERTASPNLGASLGVRLAPNSTIVRSVEPGGPAEDAGIEPDDELVAWDHHKLDRPGLDRRLKSAKPLSEVTFQLFRRSWLTEASITLAPPKPGEFDLVSVDAPSEAQMTLLAHWAAPEVE